MYNHIKILPKGHLKKFLPLLKVSLIYTHLKVKKNKKNAFTFILKGDTYGIGILLKIS